MYLNIRYSFGVKTPTSTENLPLQQFETNLAGTCEEKWADCDLNDKVLNLKNFRSLSARKNFPAKIFRFSERTCKDF